MKYVVLIMKVKKIRPQKFEAQLDICTVFLALATEIHIKACKLNMC